MLDVANGPGLRTSLFVTGCNHACPGCFNLLAQDRTIGHDFTDETIDYIIDSIRPPHVQGLTLLGGEPMDPLNQPHIRKLIEEFRKEFGETKNIWSWTGYVYPQDFDVKRKKAARAYTEHSDFLLDNIDVLIDGAFMQSLKSAKLKFRGSANQEVIDMRESRRLNEKVVIDMGDTDVIKEVYEASRKSN